MKIARLRLGRKRALLTLLIFLAIAATVFWHKARHLEIALVIGEPWEDMQARSSADILPAFPGHGWFRVPKSNARLRFNDPVYGFVTPTARFFTVSFDSEQRVRSVRMSPQVEPLLLDDTINVLLDIQEQLRHAGWKPVLADSFPSFIDTPQWRAELRNAKMGGTVYWQAGEKYQVMLVVSRFDDYRNPTQERYLMTLDLARPWVDRDLKK